MVIFSWVYSVLGSIVTSTRQMKIVFSISMLRPFIDFSTNLAKKTYNSKRFYKISPATKKGCIHSFYLCIVKTREVWVSG